MRASYGDSSQIRRRADELRDQGIEVGALAARLVAQTEAVGWSGRAADALTRRIGDRAEALHTLATSHADAADALDAHRKAVDETNDRIAAVQDRVGRLIEDARDRVGAHERDAADRGVAPEADPDDLILLGFDPPPDGHLDWLDVDLPGL